MEPLTEHERSVLLDLEMSLLGEAKNSLSLSVAGAYRNGRRRVKWSLFALITGAILMTASLTQTLIMPFAGLFIMAVSSLVLARDFPPTRRASKLLKNLARTDH